MVELWNTSSALFADEKKNPVFIYTDVISFNTSIQV